ncbi:GNAT family N-acetyltransferase [Streptomyces sp. CB01881]|uniref:GNAT family N-acetyltransferase n=1 Tax=Streptomyces sp. CB01881 TaxID=2078691 RepID=UPI000CDC3B24|nr:GNAT family N-acetyltransferase [Streptomyces sp. CB01881]AUY47686.1 GNAT family N-acetyltransferase [Streptomyces sp. CB01881]TYC76160.1 GNAT family N-acetyltransferase [Streptomyces sp. CB01881]
MLPVSVHDRAELATLLRRDPALHAYELGDLDDFFWPWTNWYRLGDSVALVYHGAGLPTLLAFDRPEDVGTLRKLLDGLLVLLPRRFHAHIAEGAEDVLGSRFDVESNGLHLRMALTDHDRLLRQEARGEQLTRADLPDLLALYETAYPGNWFDPRMLDTGQYVGVRDKGELVAVAGVHVWSPEQRIAALGNVTTHPRARGRGIGKAVVAELCRRLLGSADHVALNVKAANPAAVALYTALGFETVGRYHELSVSG